MPRKSKKNNRRKRNYTSKKREKVSVQTQGFVKTMNFLNGKKEENGFKWDSDYNGDKAHVNLWMNQNGKKKSFHKELNHQEIEKLLSVPSVEQSLDQRLLNDFPLA